MNRSDIVAWLWFNVQIQRWSFVHKNISSRPIQWIACHFVICDYMVIFHFNRPSQHSGGLFIRPWPCITALGHHCTCVNLYSKPVTPVDYSAYIPLIITECFTCKFACIHFKTSTVVRVSIFHLHPKIEVPFQIFIINRLFPQWKNYWQFPN